MVCCWVEKYIGLAPVHSVPMPLYNVGLIGVLESLSNDVVVWKVENGSLQGEE